jgi:hypothetical protein
MTDWWKLIVGGIIGFVTALFVKPLQELVTQKIRVFQLRRSLYLELSRNLNSLAHFCKQIDERADSEDSFLFLRNSLHFDSFEYASKDPILFCQVKDEPAIKILFGLFTAVRHTNNITEHNDTQHIFLIPKAIKALMDCNGIDLQLLYKHINANCHAYLLKELTPTQSTLNAGEQ